MRQALEHGYAFDPDDPRAPSEAAWERMTDEERARVVDMLPSELEPPKGDPHRVAVELRAEAEAKRAEAEASRAEAEARRASDLERQLAEALAEIERLRRN
jgi:hypothetical protein